MKRRTFISMSAISFIGVSSWLQAQHQETKLTQRIQKKIMSDATLQTDTHPSNIEKWELTKSQWQERLNDDAFDVLRKEGTERPFTSELNNEKRDGIFVCAGCGLALFNSDMKFDSGTGWPSFFDKIDGHIETKRDFKLILPRTEYHCARCGGHQGHVFNDGPAPTGLRYCNNGVALSFIPNEA